jgi:putative membrane fusion protein
MPKARRRKPNYLLMIGIVVVGGLVLWHYGAVWRAGNVTFVVAKQGWVEHQQKVQVIFANTEAVVTAPAEGKVVPLREDGSRYKKGETVARLTPSGVAFGNSLGEVAVTAPFSGLFYSTIDNLEQTITPENLLNLDLNALLTQVGKMTKESAPAKSEAVGKNAPVGKMVNNLAPSWMFVYLEGTDQVAKGDTVKFLIGGEEYAGTVMKVAGEPKGAVVRFNQYINGTTENRVQDVVWNYQPATKGTLVPLSALCTLGEERGVYVRDDGAIRFINVKVVDNNENAACVEGIPDGVEVVANPQKGMAGLAVKTKN